MGDLVSLDHYRENKKLVVMNEPCPRPFHNKEYILKDRCERCIVSVRLVNHPSMAGESPRWYG